MEKQYYILLVGINDYLAPISSLSGCINDLDLIEAYLHSAIPDSTEQVKKRRLRALKFVVMGLCTYAGWKMKRPPTKISLWDSENFLGRLVLRMPPGFTSVAMAPSNIPLRNF